jgi:hypothetical protein
VSGPRNDEPPQDSLPTTDPGLDAGPDGPDELDEPAPLEPPGSATDANGGAAGVADVDPASTDTVEVPPGRTEMDEEVENDDLAPGRADPDLLEPASDPDPAAEDVDFPGRPLTDEEIDALPVDDDLPN